MKYIAELNIIGGIVFAVSLILFVRKPHDYLMVPLALSSMYITTGLLGQYVAFRRFRIIFTLKGYRDVPRQLRDGWDVFISIAAINAYTSTRIFVVGLLTNNTITGLYTAAERISGACQTFPLLAFSQAIFPRLSAIYHKNAKKAFHLMQRIQQITVRLSLIGLPLVFIFAPWIIRIICNGDYPVAVLALRLLLISVFFVSANAFRVQFLLVSGRMRTYSRIHVTMATFGLALIVILVYIFSYTGAAMASVAIEGGIFAVTCVVVRRLSRRLDWE